MDDLPLLELFTRLRQAGLPLGVDDYQSMLQAGIGADLPVTVKDATSIQDILIDSDRAAYFHTANRNLCNSAKYPRSF